MCLAAAIVLPDTPAALVASFDELRRPARIVLSGLEQCVLPCCAVSAVKPILSRKRNADVDAGPTTWRSGPTEHLAFT